MEIVYQIFTWLILAAATLPLTIPVVFIVTALLAPSYRFLAPIVLLVIYFFSAHYWQPRQGTSRPPVGTAAAFAGPEPDDLACGNHFGD